MAANPILTGHWPDPSICRVGSDYYLATSTFEYFPGAPILHSRDLVNWRQVGNALSRLTQLDLRATASSDGMFAPTLRFHDGRFHLVTTNYAPRRAANRVNFLVTAEAPEGPWSDPLWLDQGGIDPSLFFDLDGVVYLTTTGEEGEPPGIYLSEIDLGSGARRSQRRLIWAGSGGAYPEAAHLYRRGGYLYLMIAEGGTFANHMVTVARARDPWGPYEPCPRNPILTNRHRLGDAAQGAGHADLVEAADGRWWAVCHAYRPVDIFFNHLGRETFLIPCDWTEDHWPRLNHGMPADLEIRGAETPPAHQPQPSAPPRDDFDDPQLGPHLVHLRNPEDGFFSLTERPGWLRLRGAPASLDDAAPVAFVGRRQAAFDVIAETVLDFAPRHEGEEAGLTARAGDAHHYEIALVQETTGRRLIVRRRIGDLSAVVADAAAPDGPVTLRIEANLTRYRFLAVVGNVARELAQGSTRGLSAEVSAGFVGVFFGIYATRRTAPEATPADFDYLWVEAI